MPIPPPTERFSSRVENYVRFRPSYPLEVLDLLKAECGFNTSSIVADVAYGTGIFSKLLLENGNRVFGVEPNESMRHAENNSSQDTQPSPPSPEPPRPQRLPTTASIS